VLDPYSFLEDLTREEVKRFILGKNTEVRERFGKGASIHYHSLLRKLKKRVATKIIGLDEKEYAVLYQGERGEVVVRGRVLISISGEEVIRSLERVWNSKELVVNIGKKGMDEGYSLVLDGKGRILNRIEGITDSYFYLKGSLCYVRSYRRESPPDGGETPTDRIICGDQTAGRELIRGGEFAEVMAFDETIALLVHRGWNNVVLYKGNYKGNKEFEFRKIDEGENIVVLGYKRGIIYLKGNNVLKEGEELFRSPNPVIGGVSNGDKVALIEIENYRTSLNLYDIYGAKLLEYKGENVQSLDFLGDELIFLESSFKRPYVIKRTNKGKVEEVEGSEDEDISIKDLLVKGDVELHAFLIHRGKSKGVVVYGYGGFRVPVLPGYNPLFLELVESGFSILVTNLRGGIEKGEEWHRQGMLKNKINVFKDFSTFLELAKAMGARKVIGLGRSNGGLLVASTMNLFPGLMDCGVIGYPVLDMMKFHKLHVGKYWVHEYGNPEDPEYRDYLMSYSSYHNLKRGLPEAFVYTGINDDRVHPSHALKYVAKSRDLGNKVWLFVNERGGHNLASPDSRAEEYSYIISFIEECSES
jgi:prolyl oligopeptidase